MKVVRKAEITEKGIKLKFYVNGELFPIHILFGGELNEYQASSLLSIFRKEGIPVTASQLRGILCPRDEEGNIIVNFYLPIEDWEIDEYSIIVPPCKGEIKEATKLVLSALLELKELVKKASLSGWLKEEMEWEI